MAMAQRDDSAALFAVVNGEPILQQTYEAALRTGARQRFYHGQVPEQQMAEFREEIAQRLIDERLLHQEAVRRGIEPDAAWVDAEFAKLEARYGETPQWNENAAEFHAELRDGLEQRSRIARLEEQFRQVDDPTEPQLRAYYEANPDKFTSPEQFKVSSILLQVEPWQTQEVWDDRKAEGDRVYAQIRHGTPFDEFAGKYTSEGAGDMGYLHRGMLGDIAQQAIDKLQPGDISEPVVLLEGIALFRLDDRIEARLNPLDKVRERAVELWLRERREATHAARVQALRDAAKIEYAAPAGDAARPGGGNSAASQGGNGSKS